MTQLDPQHYHQHSTIQFELAEELLAHHRFHPEETIVDVGCGDGKLTAELAKKVPGGQVLGIDPSTEMVKYALESFPHVDFAVGDAKTFKVNDQVDLVTSFSALHWVRGQKKALCNMVSALRQGGKLMILTYPKESLYFRLLEDVIYSEKWKQYAPSAACEHWLFSDQYQQIIEELSLKPIFIQTTQELATYKDEQAFKDYVAGWLPCLLRLSAESQAEFLDDLAQHAHKSYVLSGQETIQIPYSKIMMYVERVTPQSDLCD